MSVVKINAITVPSKGADEFAARFAARASQVSKADGFEEFCLLRPTDDRPTWLVYTRWRDEESFQAWLASPAFQQSHAHSGPPSSGGQGGSGDASARPGPVGISSELWSFRVEQREQVAG